MECRVYSSLCNMGVDQTSEYLEAGFTWMTEGSDGKQLGSRVRWNNTTDRNIQTRGTGYRKELQQWPKIPVPSGRTICAYRMEVTSRPGGSNAEEPVGYGQTQEPELWEGRWCLWDFNRNQAGTLYHLE